MSERVADPISEKQFEILQELIVAARNAKAELNLQKQKPSAQVACDDLRILELFRAHQESILRLAGIEALNFVRGRLGPTTPGVRRVGSTIDLLLLQDTTIDPEVERARFERDRNKLEDKLTSLDKQLGNEGFLNRAPENVVRAAQQRQKDLNAQLHKVIESLEMLSKK